MLWYKAFLDTRGRFLIGLALLPCTAAFMVLTYPRVAALLPTVSGIDTSGTLAQQIGEAIALRQESLDDRHLVGAGCEVVALGSQQHAHALEAVTRRAKRLLEQRDAVAVARVRCGPPLHQTRMLGRPSICSTRMLPTPWWDN